MSRWSFLVPAGLLTLVACNKAPEGTAHASEAQHSAAPAGEHASEGHEKEEPEAKGKKKPKKKGKVAEAPHPAHEAAGPRFGVPFVWETSPDDPLARARGHLKEVLADNSRYMKEHGARFFEGFAAGQKPRSTIVTCSDSRVQMTALDATPENDAFVIRNIGNQVENSLGSIEYGVEHLRTAVLLIMGHTGCGAVKAAMGKIDGLSLPIQRELSSLHLETTGVASPTDEVWAEAVVENVHDQVNTSLERFEGLVHEGKLTVVGAVYDFRNDLKQGSGRFVLVNVNGNTEASALRAFATAVSSDGKIVMNTREPVAAPAAVPVLPSDEDEHEASLVGHEAH
jgi:carbonic anhydrase